MSPHLSSVPKLPSDCSSFHWLFLKWHRSLVEPGLWVRHPWSSESEMQCHPLLANLAICLYFGFLISKIEIFTDPYVRTTNTGCLRDRQGSYRLGSSAGQVTAFRRACWVTWETHAARETLDESISNACPLGKAVPACMLTTYVVLLYTFWPSHPQGTVAKWPRQPLE